MTIYPNPNVLSHHNRKHDWWMDCLPPMGAAINGVMFKVWSWPRATLIASSFVNHNHVMNLLKDWGDLTWEVTSGNAAELNMEFVGRMCYMSFGDKQGRKNTHDYLANILAQGHGQLLEHATATIVFDRCSRGFTHQMVRQRAGFSFSQESTHYVDYSTTPAEFAVCGFNWQDETERAITLQGLACSLKAYSDRVNHLRRTMTDLNKATFSHRKLRQGMARDLLPSALQGRLAVTANHRAWRWFLELRGAQDNVPEIRCCAVRALGELSNLAPVLYDTMRVEVAPDGFPEIVCDDSHSRKV